MKLSFCIFVCISREGHLPLPLHLTFTSIQDPFVRPSALAFVHPPSFPNLRARIMGLARPPRCCVLAHAFTCAYFRAEPAGSARPAWLLLRSPAVSVIPRLRTCFHMCEHARGASPDPRVRLMPSHVPRPSSSIARSPAHVCLSRLRACFHMCEHARGASLDPRARLMLSHVPRPSSFMLRSLAICLVQLGLEENAFVLRRTRLFSTRGSDGQTRLWQLVFRYPASASGSNLQLRPTVNRASLPRLGVYGVPQGETSGEV